MYTLIGLWLCPKCNKLTSFKDKLEYKPNQPNEEWGVCVKCNKYTELTITDIQEKYDEYLLIDLTPTNSWVNDEYDY